LSPSTKPPNTGRLARGAVVGAAIARAGLTRLSRNTKTLGRPASRPQQTPEQARQEHDAELGRIVFAAVNQLKGTALKASQLLSMELGLLPQAMRQELARAQYQVTPLNRAIVLKVIRQEFGRHPFELFDSFNTQAFAAASLGQVHAATLRGGEALAVKLQYPGIDATVKSDMSMLRALLRAFARGSTRLPEPKIIDQLMREIEEKLAEELDYLHEAQSLLWFANHLTLPYLQIPRPVSQYCSRHVLTMQRLDGAHLDAWLVGQPTQPQRDHYGQLLFDTFMHCVFKLRRVQADPHPGNFLFMPEGQLGLLDFGCTRSLSDGFCLSMRMLWSALIRRPRDSASIYRAYLSLGIIDQSLSESKFCDSLLPALLAVQTWQSVPFVESTYDFAKHPSYPIISAEHQATLVKHLSAVPADLPYFDRAYLGLVHMLTRIGARVHTRSPWLEHS
jgi:predicted unusual protein kinase regulating ubiquinone biosynthesis (AarF/ABC1/UbiB family)